MACISPRSPIRASPCPPWTRRRKYATIFSSHTLPQGRSPMYRTRIKFCGFTREQDIDDAVAAGADAIGLVFFSRSKRYVTPQRAAQLRTRVPPFVDVVALTVNAQPQEIEQILDVVQPDILQFHGDESPEACARYGQRYLRAFRVGAPGLDTPAALLESCHAHHAAAGWLF